MPRIAEIRFALGGPRRYLVIHRSVLAHFEKYRQRSHDDCEAGGQLFASYERETITIRRATGPYATDNRTRFRFTPDRSRARIDVMNWFRTRRHFIGDWHTHPEMTPTPSALDLRNTLARFKKSEHQLLAFAMIIVGLAPFPEGLWVSLINADGHTVLRPDLTASVPNDK